MVAHGAFAHVCRGGNLLVVEATGDELCDFELAVGQADKSRGPAGRAGFDARPIKVDILDRLPLELSLKHINEPTRPYKKSIGVV